MAAIDCGSLETREINRQVRERIAAGVTEIELLAPAARHNLGVGIVQPVTLRLRGSAGYYCGGLIDGASIEIDGSAGWGVAESMLNGHVTVRGNAGNGAGAAIRGGTLVIHGDAAARLGVSMKGGTIVVGGDCGYMAGFMGQKGTLIVCGNTGEAFADSMYATTCYVGGRIAELGNDAVASPVAPEEAAYLEDTLSRLLPGASRPAAESFLKVVAGRKLWNFDHRDWSTWREAL